MIQSWTSQLLATIIPLVVGFLWYGNFLFGKTWKTLSGLTDEQMKSANMGVIFGVTLFMSFLLAMILQSIVIHQSGLYSLTQGAPGMDDPNSPAAQWLSQGMSMFGGSFRTFKHGALHGTIAGIFFVMPILVINGLFERKPMKLVFIHVGYWTVTLALMGAVICHKF